MGLAVGRIEGHKSFYKFSHRNHKLAPQTAQRKYNLQDHTMTIPIQGLRGRVPCKVPCNTDIFPCTGPQCLQQHHKIISQEIIKFNKASEENQDLHKHFWLTWFLELTTFQETRVVIGYSVGCTDWFIQGWAQETFSFAKRFRCGLYLHENRVLTLLSKILEKVGSKVQL